MLAAISSQSAPKEAPKHPGAVSPAVDLLSVSYNEFKCSINIKTSIVTVYPRVLTVYIRISQFQDVDANHCILLLTQSRETFDQVASLMPKISEIVKPGLGSLHCMNNSCTPRITCIDIATLFYNL